MSMSLARMRNTETLTNAKTRNASLRFTVAKTRGAGGSTSSAARGYKTDKPHSQGHHI